MVFVAIVALRPSGQAKRLESVDYGFVQIWNFCPESIGPINGTIKSGEMTKAEPCCTNLAPLSVAGGYTWIAPGRYTYEFTTVDGAKKSEPVRVSVDKMKWTTIVLTANEKGDIVAELVDDTYSFNEQKTGTVVFFNALPDWNFKVGIKGGTPPRQLPLRQRVYEKDLALDGSQLLVVYRPAPDRPEIEMPMPLNFRNCKYFAFISVKEVDGQNSMRIVPLGYNVDDLSTLQ